MCWTKDFNCAWIYASTWFNSHKNLIPYIGVYKVFTMTISFNSKQPVSKVSREKSSYIVIPTTCLPSACSFRTSFVDSSQNLISNRNEKRWNMFLPLLLQLNATHLFLLILFLRFSLVYLNLQQLSFT